MRWACADGRVVVQAGLGLLVNDMAHTADEVDEQENALGLRLVMADDERTRGEAENAQAETKRLMDSVQVRLLATRRACLACRARSQPSC